MIEPVGPNLYNLNSSEISNFKRWRYFIVARRHRSSKAERAQDKPVFSMADSEYKFSDLAKAFHLAENLGTERGATCAEMLAQCFLSIENVNKLDIDPDQKGIINSYVAWPRLTPAQVDANRRATEAIRQSAPQIKELVQQDLSDLISTMKAQKVADEYNAFDALFHRQYVGGELTHGFALRKLVMDIGQPNADFRQEPILKSTREFAEARGDTDVSNLSAVPKPVAVCSSRRPSFK